MTETTAGISKSRAQLAFIVGIFLTGIGHLIIRQYIRGIIFFTAAMVAGTLGAVLELGYFGILLGLPVWAASLFDLYKRVKVIAPQ